MRNEDAGIPVPEPTEADHALVRISARSIFRQRRGLYAKAGLDLGDAIGAGWVGWVRGNQMFDPAKVTPCRHEGTTCNCGDPLEAWLLMYVRRYIGNALRDGLAQKGTRGAPDEPYRVQDIGATPQRLLDALIGERGHEPDHADEAGEAALLRDLVRYITDAAEHDEGFEVVRRRYLSGPDVQLYKSLGTSYQWAGQQANTALEVIRDWVDAYQRGEPPPIHTLRPYRTECRECKSIFYPSAKMARFCTRDCRKASDARKRRASRQKSWNAGTSDG